MVLTSLHPCWISVSKGPLMGPLLDVITKLVLNFYDNGEQIVHILCQLQSLGIKTLSMFLSFPEV